MTKDQHFDYILRWADHSLILGQRLGEWCGHGPVLEEDIALTNIALDLIGQARSFLTYAGEVEMKSRDEDELAFFRDTRQYRNPILVELPNGHFGDTIVRQFLNDHFLYLAYEEMSKSKDLQLSAIAQKSIKEVAYHRKHSSDWLVRLGDGTDESKAKVQESLNNLWMYTGELFTMDDIETAALNEGIGIDLNKIKEAWHENVSAVIAEATLEKPEDGWMQKGGKQGIHSEHLGYILAEMQHLPRMYPDAKWD